jgi:4,5-DOPA dioxygenase extradiol
MKTPVLFISHGAPTFALEPGALGPQLERLGECIVGVEAVLVISPHWQTPGVRVMTTPAPETIHDFGGFAPELYRLRYDVAGQPSVAARAASLLQQAGFDVAFDDRRGLDHGAWVPLRYLLPKAQTPVLQISMPHDLDPNGALQLGRALAPLRESGVLIVGSGSLTHNLYEVRKAASDDQAAYALEFARWARQAVAARDVESLLAYRRKAPHAQRAHPTEEHFLPLLVTLGASDSADAVTTIEGGMTYGVLSMDSYAWGLNEAQATPPTRDRHGSSEKRSHLSDAEIAAICHPLQFTSPQVQP